MIQSMASFAGQTIGYKALMEALIIVAVIRPTKRVT